MEYMQIWSEPHTIARSYNYKPNLHNNLNLFLHFKTRNWENDFWIGFIKELNIHIPNIDLTVKVDNNANLNLRNVNMNNIKSLLLGSLESKKSYIESLCSSDIYMSPRITEGIGLCPQEAACSRNIVIGTNISTHNEYFSNKNGLIVSCNELYKNDSKNIMGEKKTVFLTKDKKIGIINYLKLLDKNRNYLEKVKQYNHRYAISKYEEFKNGH